MQLRRLTAAGGLAALLVVAACGGNGGDEGESGGFQEGGSAGGQNVMVPDAQAPAPPVQGAQPGGTVNVWSTSGLQSIHPTEAYFVNTTAILSGLITRSLTTYRYNYDKQRMELVPDLATDLGTPNDDFTEWTFTLRDGVKWEDGSPVTPQDVARGIEASFDAYPEGAFPNGATYTRDYFLNGDKFGGPITDPNGSCDCIEINGQDITLKMARPFPDLPFWASFPAMGPLPEAGIKNPADYALHPESTGPYKVDSFDPGTSELTLVRNENWDPDTDPARTAYPDRYEMSLGQGDPVVIHRRLLEDQGDAQTAVTDENITIDLRQQAEQTGRLVEGPAPCTYFWYMDMRKPEWQNIEVRKALGTAWNYDDYRLARKFAVGLTRIPGTTILPPGIPGRPDPPYDVLGDGGEGTGNPQKAHQMLEDANALNTPVTFLFDASDPQYVDAKNVIVKALSEAGFDPQPRAAANSDKLTEETQNPDAPINLRALGWCSDWPSGTSWFRPVFGGDGCCNYSYMDEPKVNRQIDEIEALPIEDQLPRWAQLDEEIMTDYYPVINDGYLYDAFLHGSKLMNVVNDEIHAEPYFPGIWVQQ